jgi:HrpA-like RNA helicase
MDSQIEWTTVGNKKRGTTKSSAIPFNQRKQTGSQESLKMTNSAGPVIPKSHGSRNGYWIEKNDQSSKKELTTKPAPKTIPIKSPNLEKLASEPKKGFRMPKIYDTDIPKKFLKSLRSIDEIYRNILIGAPTGHGKTVMGIIEASKLSDEYKVRVVMPFRVAVETMCNYLNSRGKRKFGFAMRGRNQTSPDDNATIYTIGYFIEIFLAEYRESIKYNTPIVPQIVFVDEVHDKSWQMDFLLSILFWLQQVKKAPIKIVMASATMNEDDIFKRMIVPPYVLSIENEKPNVNIIFSDETIHPIENNKMAMNLHKKMFSKLIDILNETPKGNIICLFPGKDEINVFMSMLVTKDFDDCNIYALHSQTSREDQIMALKKSTTRTIILGTNMLENAISIPDIDFVIDSGLRKEIHNNEGIQSLNLVKSAQSSAIQFSGRCGRFGVTGTAFQMMTQYEFESRPRFPTSEAERNPLYSQIIKLISNNLPVYEIMSHMNKEKVTATILFLLKHGALEKMPSDIPYKTFEEELSNCNVTGIGNIISQLPLSIRSAHFLALSLTTIDPQFWYVAIVTSVWIDTTTPIWFRPARRHRQSNDEYDAQVEQIRELNEEFFEIDCFRTILNMWMSSKSQIPIHKGGFHGWCKDKGIFDKTMKEMQNAVDAIIGTVAKLGFEVVIPNAEECALHLEDLNVLANGIIPCLTLVFREWIFEKNEDYLSNSQYFNTYNRNPFTDPNYTIDKNVSNMSARYGTTHKYVISINLRKINQNKVVMGNIVVLENFNIQ